MRASKLFCACAHTSPSQVMKQDI